MSNKPNKTTYEELRIKQSWALWQKVEHTKKRIKELDRDIDIIRKYLEE